MSFYVYLLFFAAFFTDVKGQAHGGGRLEVLPNCTCGIPYGNEKQYGQSGYTIDLMKYPWLVSIYQPHAINPWGACGGALIALDLVMTSAACIENFYFSNEVKVRPLSSLKWKQDRDLDVSDIIPHPNYKKSKEIKNDIALVRLSKPLQCTKFSRPICVPNSQMTRLNSKVMTSGWENSYYIQEGSVTVQSKDECERLQLWDKNRICTKDALKTICHGGVGAPGIMQYKKKFYAIGVANGDPKYCKRSGPTVYTRVAYYINFINKHLKEKRGGSNENKDEDEPLRTEGIAHMRRKVQGSGYGFNAGRQAPIPGQGGAGGAPGVGGPGAGAGGAGGAGGSAGGVPGGAGGAGGGAGGTGGGAGGANQCKCGVIETNETAGATVDLKKYPWLVSIYYPYAPNPWGVCGGGLISRDLILTSAACATSPDVRVKLLSSLKWKTDRNIPIGEIIIHKNYKNSSRNYRNDIALIRLSWPVQCTRYSRPVCIPTWNIGGIDRTMVTAGWENGYFIHEGNATIQESGICVKMEQVIGFKWDKNLLCAKDKAKTICRGGIGTPAILQDTSNKKYYAVGIATGDPLRCSKVGPTMFTRVSHYTRFIFKHLKRGQNKQQQQQQQ